MYPWTLRRTASICIRWKLIQRLITGKGTEKKTEQSSTLNGGGTYNLYHSLLPPSLRDHRRRRSKKIESKGRGGNDYKETVLDTVRQMHTWVPNAYDSMYKTCASQSQTKPSTERGVEMKSKSRLRSDGTQ